MKEYVRERDRDLRQVAMKIARLHRARHPRRELRFDTLVKKAIQEPAPNFYLSYPYALRVLSEIERGHGSWPRKPNARAQMQALHHRVANFRARNPHKTLGYALQQVLTAGRAPRFFLSEFSARLILSKPNTNSKKQRS